MAITFDVNYPKDLTNAAWQKKKSLLDKAKKATKVSGLGAALTKAEEAWQEIDFMGLDIGSANKRLGNPDHIITKKQIDEAKVRAQKHYTEVVKPASATLLLAAKQAQAVVENTANTKTTIAAAKSINSKLLKTSLMLRGIKFTDFDLKKKQKEESAKKTFEVFVKGVETALSNGESFVQKVKTTPTAKTFNDSIENSSRRLTQITGNIYKYKDQGIEIDKDPPTALFEELSPWANKGEKLSEKAEREQVLEEIGKFERILNDIQRWWA